MLQILAPVIWKVAINTNYIGIIVEKNASITGKDSSGDAIEHHDMNGREINLNK